MFTTLFISLAATLTVWALLMVYLLFLKTWPLAALAIKWQTFIYWITGSLTAIALINTILLLAPSCSFTLILYTLIPRAAALIAAHIFFNALKLYLSFAYHHTFTRFYTVLLTLSIYALFSANFLLALLVDHAALVQFSNSILTYFLYGSLFGTAALHLFLHRLSSTSTDHTASSVQDQHEPNDDDTFTQW